MKNIFLILTTTLLFTFCKAQVPSTAPIISIGDMNESNTTLANTGTYYKDVENKYNQWVGTWQYQNGNTIFKIVIQKIEGVYVPQSVYNPINHYMDLLVGGYYYEVDGVTITNHLSVLDPLNTPLKCIGVYTTPNDIRIFYKEIEKRPGLTGGTVIFTLLPGSTTQAKWEFDPVKKRNYSVPDNVILTKL